MMILGYNNRRAGTWAYYDLDKTPPAPKPTPSRVRMG